MDVGGRADVDVVGGEVALVAGVGRCVEEGVRGEDRVEWTALGGGLAGCPVGLWDMVSGGRAVKVADLGRCGTNLHETGVVRCDECVGGVSILYS